MPMNPHRFRFISKLFILLGLWFFLVWSANAQKVVAWNLEWFPGRKPSASAADSKAHMLVAQETLKKLDPDIFISEEIRDWKAFADLVSVVPGLQVNVVSAFRSQ